MALREVCVPFRFKRATPNAKDSAVMSEQGSSNPNNGPKFAWAIERSGHSGIYFSPGKRGDKWEWTTTAFDEAVRFVTQEDAQRVISMFRTINSTFFQGLEWVATEHGWLEPNAPETPAALSDDMRKRMLADEELSEEEFEARAYRIALEAHEDRLKLWESLHTDPRTGARTSEKATDYKSPPIEHHQYSEAPKEEQTIERPPRCPIGKFNKGRLVQCVKDDGHIGSHYSLIDDFAWGSENGGPAHGV